MEAALEASGGEEKTSCRREVLLRRQASISCSFGEAPSSFDMVGRWEGAGVVVGWLLEPGNSEVEEAGSLFSIV